jgi:hypothetical protein
MFSLGCEFAFAFAMPFARPQVHALRKQYLASHWDRMQTWQNDRLNEWNRVQSERQARTIAKRAHGKERLAISTKRNALMSSAFSALKAQRTAHRCE